MIDQRKLKMVMHDQMFWIENVWNVYSLSLTEGAFPESLWDNFVEWLAPNKDKQEYQPFRDYPLLKNLFWEPSEEEEDLVGGYSDIEIKEMRASEMYRAPVDLNIYEFATPIRTYTPNSASSYHFSLGLRAHFAVAAQSQERAIVLAYREVLRLNRTWRQKAKTEETAA